MILPINDENLLFKSNYRSTRLRIKLQSMKIRANQIVKKKWEKAKKASSRTPDEKHYWNIVFFERAPRLLLISVLKHAKVIRGGALSKNPSIIPLIINLKTKCYACD